MIMIVREQCVGNLQPSCAAADRPGKAPLGIFSALGPTLALCLGFAATDAVAASTHHEQTRTAHSIHGRSVVDHQSKRHVAGHRTAGPGYGRSEYLDAPMGLPVQPDARFVPGRGIEGVSCDLPTSACPNDVRIAN